MYVIYSVLQSLLMDPDPASPANPEAAQLYQTDMQAYNRYLSLKMIVLFY